MPKQKTVQKQHTPEMIRKELQESTAFASVEKIGDEKERNKALEAARKDYLERMMEGSVEKNKKLQDKASSQEEQKREKNGRKSVKPSDKEQNWKAAVPEKSSFRQKLPKVKGERKWWQVWKTDENDEVAKLKKIYRNADICTLREYNSMKEYFKNGGHKELSLMGTEGQEQEKAYLDIVNAFLAEKITAASFTDDYLSENMPRLYDYVRQAEDIDAFRVGYPKLYAALPYAKRLELTSACEAAKDMKGVLDEHLYRHGIVISKDLQVGLRNEPVRKDERHRLRREEEEKYSKKREEHLMNREYGQTIYQAEALAKMSKTADDGNGFSSESQLKIIDELIASKPEAYDAYGPEVRLAYEEIKRVLSVRDGSIEELRKMLPDYYKLKGEEAQKKKEEIKVLTDRCALSAAQVEHYRSYIRYIMGDLTELPKDTDDFLRKQKLTELTELVDFRRMGDSLEEALAIQKRVAGGISNMEDIMRRSNEEQMLISNLVEDLPPAEKGDKKAEKERSDVFRRRMRDARKDETLKFLVDCHGLYNEKRALKRLELVNQHKQECEEGIEELKKKYPIKGMPTEQFFSLAGQYHEKRRVLRNMKKWSADAERVRKNEMSADAQAYAEKNGMKKEEKGFASVIRDPFQEEKDQMWSWFYKAVVLTPTKDTKPEAIEELRQKGVLPILKKITELDGDAVNRMGLTAKTDWAKQETWDNYTMVRIGSNMSLFRGVLQKYGIELSREEDAKLTAFYQVSGMMLKRYMATDNKDRTPMETLVEQKGIYQKTESLLRDVTDIHKARACNDAIDWRDKYGRLGSYEGNTYPDAMTKVMRKYDYMVQDWKKSEGNHGKDFEQKLYELEPDIFPQYKNAQAEKKEEEKRRVKEQLEKERKEREQREKEQQEKERQELEKRKEERQQQEERREREERERREREEKERLKIENPDAWEDTEEYEIDGEKKTRIIISKDSAAVRKVKEEETRKYAREDYPEVKRLQYESILRDKGCKVPQDSFETDRLRSKHTVVKYWYEDDGKGKQILRGNYFWQEGTDPVLKEACDWLMGYFRSRDKGTAKTGPLEKQEMPDLHFQLKGPKDWYEKQEAGSNNCWCCAGTAMYNQFVGKKEFKQRDMRNFIPDYKKSKEITDQHLELSEYERHVAMTQSYAGPNNTAVGNIFEMGDFFLKQNKDMMVNRMVFHTPALESGNKTEEHKKNDEILYHNQKAAFLKQIHAVLKSGNAVGILKTWGEKGHYLTIVGIEGENLTVLDSSPGEPLEKIMSVMDLLPRKLTGGSTEITYLSKLKKKDELLKEYSNLTYEEGKGYGVREVQAESAFNVAQTRGVCVSKYPSEMEKGMEGISLSVYIPKQAG